jgi:hypothetical protein
MSMIASLLVGFLYRESLIPHPESLIPYGQSLIPYRQSLTARQEVRSGARASGCAAGDSGHAVRECALGEPDAPNVELSDWGSAIGDQGSEIQDQGSGIRDVIDRLLAVVGGQTITLSDVNAAIQFQLVDVPAGTSDPVAYTLDRLIDRTLILAEVDRFQPPEPDPIEMTTRIDEMQRRAGSAAAFDRALAVTGRTREELRRDIRDDLRIATYINQRFGATTAVAERTAAVAGWVSDLRKRGDVTVLYRGT